MSRRWLNIRETRSWVAFAKPVSKFGYEVRNEHRASGIDTNIATLTELLILSG